MHKASVFAVYVKYVVDGVNPYTFLQSLIFRHWKCYSLIS